MSLDFDRWEQRKARKRHICHLCHKPILRGVEYIYQTQKYDGSIQTLKRHIHCDALLDEVLANPKLMGWAGEYTDDEVAEELREVCAVLHNYGECTEDDYEQCGNRDCFACYLVQRAVLKNPVKLRAAEQSVKDNDEDK